LSQPPRLNWWWWQGKLYLLTPALNGKRVYVGDVAHAVREPEAFLAAGDGEAKAYQAPAAAAVEPAKAAGQKRIVAITACPTGVGPYLYGGRSHWKVKPKSVAGG
jgi:hypothetical protein